MLLSPGSDVDMLASPPKLPDGALRTDTLLLPELPNDGPDEETALPADLAVLALLPPAIAPNKPIPPELPDGASNKEAPLLANSKTLELLVLPPVFAANKPPTEELVDGVTNKEPVLLAADPT